MRKVSFLLAFLVVFSLFTPLFSQKVHAGELTPSQIRLTRQSVSATVGALVCVTTPNTDNGTENNVQVNFPTGFGVNTNASNWTTDTANLPTGATSWPGIGNATSVNGQIVTFPSNNLSSSTQYCFNFASTNTLTNPSTNGSFAGSIRTRNGIGTTIDSIDIGLAITTNDQINVTATVPANPTDFEANLQLINPGNGTFSQKTELTYKLTYGSQLPYPTSITVEASWDLGTVSGSSTPTENLLDYVIGSATNGYNNSPPVVDSTNRRIYWTITPFPASTSGEYVTFKLITNSSYRGKLPVSFSVNGNVQGPGTQTADSTVTSSYRNSQATDLGPNDGKSDGKTDGMSDGLSSTTLTPIRNYLTSINIRKIGSTNAEIFVGTNFNSKVKLNYGTTIKSLFESINSDEYSYQHLLKVNDLKPKTRYYFRVVATGVDGKTVGSDIYLLDTATLFAYPTLITNSIIISIGDVLLTNSVALNGKIPNIIIPTNTSFAFKFAIAPFDSIKSVLAILRDDNVLGVTQDIYNNSSASLPVTEISPGQFIGKFTTYPTTGKYRLVLQIKDYNGNISEQTASILYVVHPFKIIDSESRKGIENAKVTLFYYNFRQRTFNKISSNTTSIKNPNTTDSNGYVLASLPEGKYKAEVEVLGYKSRTVEFEIGPDKDNYPTLELVKSPFNLLTFATYHIQTFVDAFVGVTEKLQELRLSNRLSDLIAFSTLLLFALVSTLSLSKKLAVPILAFPYYLFYHLVILFIKPKHNFLVHGNLTSDTGEAINGAVVYFSQPSGKVINHTRTNALGEFIATIHEAIDVKVTISKKGYRNFSEVIKKVKLNDKQEILMAPINKPSTLSFSSISWYINYLLASLFEAILIISLLFELFFVFEFGIVKTLPFILISLLNIILWAAHARPRLMTYDL